MEPEESHCVAAVREVVEEAGVRGQIDRCIGVFEVHIILLIEASVIDSLVNLNVLFLLCRMKNVGIAQPFMSWL